MQPPFITWFFDVIRGDSLEHFCTAPLLDFAEHGIE